MSLQNFGPICARIPFALDIYSLAIFPACRNPPQLHTKIQQCFAEFQCD